MSGELQFSADEVGRHAHSVDGIADAVRLARGAVHEMSMDTQAYGQLCQFLPGLLTPLFALAVKAMDAAAGNLDATAANLRTTAGEISATDDAAAARVRTAGRSLPELPL